MTTPPNHPPIPASRIGVLLVNLGTPDAPTPKAVRRYLKQFLSDRRVVEIPPLLWQPILRGISLNTRPRKSAHAYAQVWTEAGSPLAAITAAQAKALHGLSRALINNMVKGVSEEDAQKRVLPMNCLSWNVGHLAWQEQRYFLHYGQGVMLLPEIDREFAYGAPGSTPSLKEMLAAWKTITAELV